MIRVRDTSLSDETTVQPAKALCGELELPGDKSTSHRAAIIAALAQTGTSRIKNFSTAEDCQSTLSCLQDLGVDIKGESPGTVHIKGVGSRGFFSPTEPLNCDNSGSTMRLLAGALAGLDVTVTLTGDGSLLRRPMQWIVEPLTKMGAQVRANNGCAPLTVSGQKSLNAIRYEMPVASSQLKSTLLLAGLNARGRTEIIEPETTRDHTERILRWFGVDVFSRSVDSEPTNKTEISLQGPQGFGARDVRVPGDISSAAYFIVAAALLPGSNLRIKNVGLNPTRTTFISILRDLGVSVRTHKLREECNEPVGDVSVAGVKDLRPTQKDLYSIRKPVVAQAIDELPILAVLGAQVHGGIEIRDAKELRFKECDQIAATIRNLCAMGAEVEEFEDGLSVAGPVPLRGARLDSCGDHRIAMAFTVAALIADGNSESGRPIACGYRFRSSFRCWNQ